MGWRYGPNEPCRQCGSLRRNAHNRCVDCKNAWARGETRIRVTCEKRCLGCNRWFRRPPSQIDRFSCCSVGCRRGWAEFRREHAKAIAFYDDLRARVYREPMTCEEVGLLMGITGQAAWEIEQRALSKLRKQWPQMAEHLMGE